MTAAIIADKRGRLEEKPFSYQPLRDDRLELFYQGKRVVSLSGREAIKLLQRLEMADSSEQQLLLAKATGNFKRGNERPTRK